MEPNHKLDQWLDQALTDLGHAEPRTGLEARVLSNLATEKFRAARRRSWSWAFSSVAVTITVVLALWSWLSMQKPRTPPKLANNKIVLQKKESAVAADATVQVFAPPSAKRRKPRQVAKAPEPENAPRLSQFPSFRELSEQEHLLVQYAREFPDQALKISQAQAAADRERVNGELTKE
jgi:hypothetical protein